MIKFVAGGGIVKKFLLRYQAWCQWRQLAGPHIPVAYVEDSNSNNGPAIIVHRHSDIDRILRDTNPVIAIDLKEGIKEARILNHTLPRDKHYIIFSGSHPGTVVPIEVSHTLICHDHILATMMDLHMHSTAMFFYGPRCYDFDQPKTLNFVSFASAPRPHRQQFAQWLTELNYSNFVFRLDGQDWGWPADNLDFVKFDTLHTDLAQWFQITAQHMSEPHLHIMGRIPIEMMNAARVNLVLETAFSDSGFDTTEKTIRPLMLGMPFVLASAAGHLSRLHSMGFRTYSEVWDESYDLEPDNDTRLRKIFSLIQSLGSFDWHQNLPKLREIGMHNRANFANLGWWFDREFREFESKMQRLNPCA